MKTFLFLILFPLLALTCPAAEIVGWKVPLSGFVENGLEADGIVRCKSAPEAPPFFFAPSEDLVNRAAILLMPDCMLQPALITASLDGGGRIRLVARSGKKASLKRCVADKPSQRNLEIEPTIGENDNVIDMRLYFEDMVDSQRVTRLDTSTTIMTGKLQELLSGSQETAPKSSLRLKAEVLRISLD